MGQKPCNLHDVTFGYYQDLCLHLCPIFRRLSWSHPPTATLVLSLLSTVQRQLTYAERTDDKRCHLNKGPRGIRAPDTQFPRGIENNSSFFLQLRDRGRKESLFWRGRRRHGCHPTTSGPTSTTTPAISTTTSTGSRKRRDIASSSQYEFE
ncbi:hypothetical protein ALC57_04685 [Trachymyrmex cornetzi]|uniref:Uncharacterized protein n=1 Tax=Trachymyrmex cornetzi TaxID=471704 RepID=A0A195EDL5_9HYME|nr:hypothetical protein ALC57_04685 [Trachymyrmex cornetzi]